MTRRDALIAFAAVILVVGLTALLVAGAAATARSATVAARPRVFFDVRSSPPPARTVVELETNLPEPLRPLLPLQRGVSDAARDAAGYLLILLGTSAALVLAREQVVRAYRASLGGWRAQLRLVATGLAVLGLTASGAALSWVVFLASLPRLNGPFGIAAALQMGIAAFTVALVVGAVVALIGFAAAAWRLGDAVFQTRWLRPHSTAVPAPLIALLGATFIYIAWQIPYLGAAAVIVALAYALGAVVMARLGPPSGAPQTAR
jgi:hypothetical protein